MSIRLPNKEKRFGSHKGINFCKKNYSNPNYPKPINKRCKYVKPQAYACITFNSTQGFGYSIFKSNRQLKIFTCWILASTTGSYHPAFSLTAIL